MDKRIRRIVPFLRLEAEGGIVISGGVRGGVVALMSSSGSSLGWATGTLLHVVLVTGTRRMPPLLSRTRLPGTCVRGV